MTKDTYFVSGKRKRAIAKARVQPGSGIVYFNGLPHTELQQFHSLALREPLMIAQNILGDVKYDVFTRARGGGKEGQIQAARLAVAKALFTATKSDELKTAFIKYDRHLLVADIRRKETRKPGDSKARAKRQKSYR